MLAWCRLIRQTDTRLRLLSPTLVSNARLQPWGINSGHYLGSFWDASWNPIKRNTGLVLERKKCFDTKHCNGHHVVRSTEETTLLQGLPPPCVSNGLTFCNDVPSLSQYKIWFNTRLWQGANMCCLSFVGAINFELQISKNKKGNGESWEVVL